MSDITTTDGKKFSTDDSARMAYLVYRRFGGDEDAACAAWRRLLQNNCSVVQFMQLVIRGNALKEGKA